MSMQERWKIEEHKPRTAENTHYFRQEVICQATQMAKELGRNREFYGENMEPGIVKGTREVSMGVTHRY